MRYTIRKCRESDYGAILAMVRELATFEQAADKVVNTEELMKAEKQYFDAYVVVNEDDTVIGMALYFFAYFTWVGKSLYLDDLYVKPEYRGMGIGSTLLKMIFALAKSEHCRRLRWQVLDWNEAALRLYRKVGATIDGGWCNCDFDAMQIANF